MEGKERGDECRNRSVTVRSLSLPPSAATVVLQQHRQQSPGRPWQHPDHPGLLHKQLRRSHHAGTAQVSVTCSSRPTVYLLKITVQLRRADYQLISTLFLTKDCLCLSFSPLISFLPKLKHGAKLCKQNRLGHFPIHAAAFAGAKKALEVILDIGMTKRNLPKLKSPEIMKAFPHPGGCTAHQY